jgi:hypothetical protein
VRGIDRERVLARRPGKIPGREEVVPSPSVPAGGVRHAAALEPQAHAAPCVVRTQNGLGVVERGIRRVEAPLQPARPRDLCQYLREAGSALFDPCPPQQL